MLLGNYLVNSWGKKDISNEYCRDVNRVGLGQGVHYPSQTPLSQSCPRLIPPRPLEELAGMGNPITHQLFLNFFRKLFLNIQFRIEMILV